MRPRRESARRRRGAIALAVVLACAAPAAGGEPRAVTVLVPGVTGVSLELPGGGPVRWGNGVSLLWPRDRGYSLAWPISGYRDPLLAPGRVMDEVRLTRWLGKPVYGPIFGRLEQIGMRRGELSAAEPADDLFGFAYDWRQSNVESARELAAALAALARARAGGPLPVRLLCQSNGAHVCRWLAKYGAASLAEAEDGRSLPAAGVRLERLVLVGASNGGSLRILREMNRGRRYVPGIGRPFRSEVFFTFRSLFQDLPADAAGLFVDLEGRPLPVDLWRPESWWTYGWSIFDPAARRRLDCRPRPELFGDEAERREFVGRALDDARRFQRLLAADPPGYRPPPIYQIANASQPTPVHAVLTRKRPGAPWRTLFPGDRAVARRPGLEASLLAPGDGHASADSQASLSPAERRALVAVAEVTGEHFEMILEPETLDALDRFLLSDPAAAPGGGSRRSPDPRR